MSANTLLFEVGDYVVYPKHGVGRVIELQRSEIAGMQLELYVLRFEKEKMTLRVPTNKAEGVGMRKLSSDKTLKEALQVLTTKPKVKRTMWSRRAQEYEAKINSGDLVSIAEVTRDLFRADDQPDSDQSPAGDPAIATGKRWRLDKEMIAADNEQDYALGIEALRRISRIFSSAAGSSISSIAASSRARRDAAASKICRSE
jgi:CarD family transcriptional regulator